MPDKDQRFELRLTTAEFEALQRLADLRGKSMSKLIAAYIKRTAKREKVWQ